jgi:hypothetical protein
MLSEPIERGVYYHAEPFLSEAVIGNPAVLITH